ncbi:alanine--tRNA ligase [bacterium]|nr:alanine--tRNA ligase [bacterium]
MKSSEVRQSFLDFFAKYDHKIVPSAPVAPLDDPTLLFTNAGMNQFKDVFLGMGTRAYRRAADAQKCIRVSGKHNDLEEVGHDSYHHTFFEMLGNWSFGDYYKEEAIRWAWELIAQVWNLPKSQLYATVFSEDKEAESLWKKVTDIDPSHVLRFNEKDNFWEMGASGPCGPCSEIHIDLGEEFCDKQHVKGHKCGLNAGCARFIELWNLVFIQYNRDESGNLHPLPRKHVDTGMGFERVTAVLQGKKSNYQTDIFTPLLDRISQLSSVEWKESKQISAFRVIADHIRALTFAITDGVLPSNEGRGYVLRRLLRRAARYGRNLDMHEPFIYKLVPTLINTMGHAYPEIQEREKHTIHVIQSEEERFNDVLDRGIEMFEILVADILKKGQKIIPGAEAFRLYDTYGFPLDLTQLMAHEKGLSVDETGFHKEMDEQRKRARKSAQFNMKSSDDWIILTEGDDSNFIGYETTVSDANIRQYQTSDDLVLLILDQTPFYAESGGQVGDKGIVSGNDFQIRIDNTLKQGDRFIHIGQFESGNAINDPAVKTRVNRDERLATARNHTATHLLHKSLKHVLGDHVNQAGSLVEPDRLRFDFTHFEPMSVQQIDQVEWKVNRCVRENLTVESFTTSLPDAKAQGATALFGEKYSDTVRVVKIDEFSMELCGGTHLDSTGQIGYFRIMSEESVSAGVRRIEAITGEAADHFLRIQKKTLQSAAALLKCTPDEIGSRIELLIEDRKNLERKLRQAQKMSAGSDLEALLQKAVSVQGVPVVTGYIESSDVETLRNFGDQIRNKMPSGVAVLGAVIKSKVNLLCVITDDLIKERDLKAGEVVREAAKIVDGSGGGKPHMALAGGKDKSKLQTALDAVPKIIQSFLK